MFPREPVVIMWARETIKPKIIIINLNPMPLSSKGMIMCLHCLYQYHIIVCKRFLCKLENSSQDKNLHQSVSISVIYHVFHF